ncbi:hypothetical protein KKE14_00320 [Patescibacteria group bacterium]|nr:hypothetical protein [Patescibacteria group bacterium]
MNKLWGKTSGRAVTLLLALLVLVGGCGQPKEGARLTELTIASQVNADNSPVNSQNVFLSSTPAIYFTAKAVDAIQGTRIDIRWMDATRDQVLATEVLRGGRNKERPQEFMLGLKPATSYIYSKINLTGVGWLIGTYEVQVKVDGKDAGQLNFNIVGDKDFDLLTKKTLLKSFYLGSQINQNKQVTIPGTTFSSNQEKIYAVALFKEVPANTDMKVVWKYLDGNQDIDSFYTKFSGSGYLAFDISLEKFGRLWPNRLWPKGNFEVFLYVDNVLIITKNFTVS